VSVLHKEKMKVDIVVLNAAVVDPTPIKTKSGSGNNRMFVVNYLANVVLVNELVRLGRVKSQANVSGPAPRIVIVSSGTYARGHTGTYGATASWGITEAVRYYGQSKWELQMWAVNTAAALAPHIDIVSYNPGPVMTELGDEHVPWVLAPTLHAMKRLFFPAAAEAAKPLVVMALDRSYKSGAYVHIREDRTTTLVPGLFDKQNFESLMKQTQRTLKQERVSIALTHLLNLDKILLHQKPA